MADRRQHRQTTGGIIDSVKSILPDRGPTKTQALAVAMLFPTGSILFVLSGLALAASIVGLGLLAPIFLLFSPVLVPASLLMALAVTGFLTSGALGLGGLSSLAWFARAARDVVIKAPEEIEQSKRKMAEADASIGQKAIPAMADRGQHRQTTGGIIDSVKSIITDRGPTKTQALAVAMLFLTGGILLSLSGLALAACVIGLGLLAPIFLLFSPVLVPASLLMAIAVTGFLTSGALGLGGLSSLAWFARAARDMVIKAPEEIEQSKRKMAEADASIGQKAKDTAQEAAGKTDK